ncbi:autorepressor SdpR family transcription factor [Patescibacteria group bacterium]|nr:autorepressor SdpR family transcription factor [Patescibacteria group bacterium]
MEHVFKALADPNRRKILELLKKRSMSVTDLLENFDFTQASLSHHLDILKRANLVVTERQGQFIYYSLNLSVFEEISKTMFNLFQYEKSKK